MNVGQVIDRLRQGLLWSGAVDETDLPRLNREAQRLGMVVRELPGQANEVRPYVVVERAR